MRSRGSWKTFTLAAVLWAGPALAEPVGAARPGAWRPKWTAVRGPSEHVELRGTSAQRIFHPQAAIRFKNHLSDAVGPEIVVAGLETGHGAGQPRTLVVKSYDETTDRYSRIHLPQSLTTYGAGQALAYQGVGTAGKHLVIAGGAHANNMAENPSAQIAIFNVQTHRATVLPGQLKTARAMPMVGASPDGRYIVVAGGVALGQARHLTTQASVDVIDRRTGAPVTDKFEGLNLLGDSGLPEPRVGGRIVWIKERGIDRIFFIGGTTAFNPHEPDVLKHAGTATVPVYDVNQGEWGKVELGSARNGAAVAVRRLADGRPEIVVAGGVTRDAEGTTQSYAVERIDPARLTVRYGEHLPEQPAFYVHHHKDNARSVHAAPNAMTFSNEPGVNGTSVSKGVHLFGHGAAYKGELE